MKIHPTLYQAVGARIILVTLLAAFAVPTSLSAQAVTATVAITNGTAGSVAVNRVTNMVYVSTSAGINVFNGTSNTLLATIPSVVTTQGLAINQTTNRIYAINSTGDSVSVIDGATNTLLTTVPTGTGPQSLTINPVTNMIYVPCKLGNSLTVINGATNTTSTITTGYFAVGPIAVNAVTNTIYALNPQSNGVFVIDGKTNAVTATVTVGSFPADIAVDETTNKIYTANLNDGTLTEIDGAANTIATITLPNNLPPSAYPLLAVNPLTNKIYAATTSGVAIVDGSNRTTTAVTVGGYSRGLVANPADKQIYVLTSSGLTTIDAITTETTTLDLYPKGLSNLALNTATHKLYGVNSTELLVLDDTLSGINNNAVSMISVPVPTYVGGLAVNSATNKAYFVSAGNLTVLDGATHAVSATIPLDIYSSALVLNPATNKLYVTSSNPNITIVNGITNATTTLPLAGVAATNGVVTATALNPKTNKLYLGGYVYGSSPLTGFIAIIDGASDTIIATLPTGPVAEMAANPTTNKIYFDTNPPYVATNNGPLTVNVLDGASNAIQNLKTIPSVNSAGNKPSLRGLAVNPATNKLFFLLDTSLVALDGLTNAETDVNTGTQLPEALAINTVTNKIYIGNSGNLNGQIEIIVVDGLTYAITTVDLSAYFVDGASSLPVLLAVNSATNQIYWGQGPLVLNGLTNQPTSLYSPFIYDGSRQSAIGINQITDEVYIAGITGFVTVVNAKYPPTLSTTNLNFGSQSVSTPSATQFVTVTNNGTANLTLSPIQITGPNAADFTLTNGCTATLSPAAVCTLGVSFKPSTAAPESATLSVTGNSSPTPQTVALSGTGTGGATPTSFTTYLAPYGGAALTLSGASVVVPIRAYYPGGASQISLLLGNFKSASTGALEYSVIAHSDGAGNYYLYAFNGTTYAPSGTFPTLSPNGSTITLPTPITLGTLKISAYRFALVGKEMQLDLTLIRTGAFSDSINIQAAAGTNYSAPWLAVNGYWLSSASAAPAVTLSSTSLNFGVQMVSTTATQAITVTNSGTANLTLSALNVTGSNAADFTATNGCTAAIAPGASCALTVTFKPSTGSAESATLNIADNASNSPQTVQLSGTGVATAPAVTLSPSSLNFGTQTVASTATQTITVTNSGTANLTVSALNFTGANAPDFAATNGCTAVVSPGSTCSIGVIFKPSVASAESATLNIADNAPSSPQTVALSGTGTAAAPPTTFTTYLAPYGGAAPTLSGASVVVPIRAYNPSGASQITLLLGNFKNASTGALEYSLIAHSDGAGNYYLYAFNGTTYAPSGTFPTLSPSGSTVTLPTPITLGTLKITAYRFALVGKEMQLDLTLNRSGAFSNSINIQAAAGTNYSAPWVAVHGYWLSSGSTNPAPAVTLSPTSLNFGTQTVSTKVSQSITVTNSGTANLTVSGVSTSGANPSDFGITNGCTAAVLPAASCTIGVTFSPSTTSAESATLSITGNASNSPQTVSLSGTGTSAATPNTFTSYLAPYGSAPPTLTGTSAVVPMRVYYPGGASQINFLFGNLNNAATGATEYTVILESDDTGNYFLRLTDGVTTAPSIPTLNPNGSTVTFTTPITLGSLQIKDYRFALVGNEMQLDLTLSRAGTFSDTINIRSSVGSNYSFPWIGVDGYWHN